MFKLEFKDRRQPGIWLVESVLSIGSGSKSQLIIDDDSVQPQHAEICLDDGYVYLSDVCGLNSTRVNGKKISSRLQLRSGDAIQLGQVELEVSDPKERNVQPAASVISPSVGGVWSLMALSGDLKGKSMPIHGAMVIGRSTKCDIVITSEHMSRRHAELSLKAGGLRIVDLGSSNGTCVNGNKVVEQQLKPGDKISFDQVVFLVAGPATASGLYNEDEEDEEATLFRAIAPMPKAAPARRKAAPAVSSVMEERIVKKSSGAQTGKLIIVAVSVFVVAAIAALVAFV